MKNPIQAKVKALKKTSITPPQKLRGTELPPSADHSQIGVFRPGRSILTSLDDPFQGETSFEVILDWIGDTMEPEVFRNNLAFVSRRKDPYPCAGELILGLLAGRHLVFGAHEYHSPGLCRISFINPEYAPAYYPEKEFRWIYPIDFISVMGKSCLTVIKKLEFFPDDE